MNQKPITDYLENGGTVSDLPKEVQEALEKDIDIQIDQAVERQQHTHRPK